VVLAGFVTGILLPEAGFNPGIITEWTLNVLLFLIGMQFRQSNIPLVNMLKSPAVIALPLATAVGSLLGGILLAPLFSLPLPRALALASGFGWYSLSGVLISNLGDPMLGSSAFLANMIRESLGLLLIPVLGQTRVPAMAISVAGATSMDVSLPLIEQTLGPEAVPLSFISGAFLSALVPVLVPLFMKL
ncbi:MAG: lysine exporter LysO family protein, partial [Rectinema sp.]